VRSRLAAAVESAVFLFVAPGVVAGWIPWQLTRWRLGPPLLDGRASRAMGVLMILAGVPVLLESVARFAFVGRGTPAPIVPTERLVVSGLYRYVRNPMYLAVVSVVFGQALLFGSRELLGYGALIWIAFHLFVLFYEEPTLRRRYGDAYVAYRSAVPRWWPRARGYPAGER
jgi:protein-S-isoprenylcysteine O-methyltransferase Ste14